MKRYLLPISILFVIALFSFAAPNEDESVYSSKYIKYSVERSSGGAVVSIDVPNLDRYQEIYLRRSDNPTNDFRQVKYLAENQIKDLANNKTITDNYPLPGNIDAYYKLTAISKDGIYQLFPCVKLSKY